MRPRAGDGRGSFGVPAFEEEPLEVSDGRRETQRGPYAVPFGMGRRKTKWVPCAVPFGAGSGEEERRQELFPPGPGDAPRPVIRVGDEVSYSEPSSEPLKAAASVTISVAFSARIPPSVSAADRRLFYFPVPMAVPGFPDRREPNRIFPDSCEARLSGQDALESAIFPTVSSEVLPSAPQPLRFPRYPL